MIRKPIVTVVGHVDHGKTSFLDAIRSSTVTEREAGKITQAIGASIIPAETIKRVCGPLLSEKLRTSGLLFIDTPGHAAFSSLRKRGGNLADIAVLVVDLNEGFMPQTEEAIEILRAAKTPFVIAANKLDLLPGWKKTPLPLLSSVEKQSRETQTALETKLYELVGKMHEKFQIDADRFDRVQDYTKQIAIVPMSAMSKEGLPELLMVLVGLVQKYLEKGLEINEKGNAKGTILEVKDQKGMGKMLDVILYDGSLHPGELIVIGGIDGAITTKVRGLFEPNPHAEMMEKKVNYLSVKEAIAATGVRVFAPGVENVVAGMPIVSCSPQDEEACREDVQSQVDEVVVETDKEGLVAKADTLGSLDALKMLLKEKNIPIRKATLGEVSKKDILDAQSNYDVDPLTCAVLAFNVGGEESTEGVKVIKSDIIYKVIDEYELWVEEMKRKEEIKELDTRTRPCKIEILKGYVFRQSSPAVVGISVEVGVCRTGMPLMTKEGKEITIVKGLQAEQKNISKAEKGKEVACSMPEVTVGRQIKEGMILYSSMSEEDFVKLKELKHLLKPDELEVMKEIAIIKRVNNPVWGV